MAISSDKEDVWVVAQRLDDGSLSIHLTVSDIGPPVVTKIQTQQMEGLNRYLASGNGRGRLNSAATIYQGKIGYFFVSKTNVGGEQQEAIFFSYDTGGDESGLASSDTILITHFPAQKKG